MRSPQEISISLELLANLMDVIGENEFKIRAHRVAAEICQLFPGDTVELLKQINGPGIPKIGANLATKITALSENSEIPELLELKTKVPLSVLDLRQVPGLGPKKVKVLFNDLKITNLEMLEEACKKGLLKNLKGFGEKIQLKIEEGIAQLKRYKGMMRLPRARQLAQSLVESISQQLPIVRCEVTGELRRNLETISEVCILVSGAKTEQVFEIFKSSAEYVEQEFCDQGKCIKLKTLSSEKIAIQIVKDTEFAFALLESTGDQDFANWFKIQTKGLKTQAKTEIELFHDAGLPYIVPERREKENAEIWPLISAQENEKLITVKDIKGIVHCHSTYSDGVDSLAEMAKAAKAQGFLYLGIADHSVSAAYAGGLSQERVCQQHKEIDDLNQRLAPFRILKGIESDILSDGNLDYSDQVLRSFDFVVASVHSGFQMSKQEMTARIIKAIRNPYTSILGHVTGRLLLEREGYQLDLEEVIKVAAQEGVVLEINASPYRLDLDWRWIQFAKSQGAKFSIDPDSHRIAKFSDIEYGVAVARKAGLTAEDVVTSMSTNEFLKSLKVKH